MGSLGTLSDVALFCLGDSSSHARDQYESMETDEGGQSGPARCEFLYSES